MRCWKSSIVKEQQHGRSALRRARHLRLDMGVITNNPTVLKERGILQGGFALPRPLDLRHERLVAGELWQILREVVQYVPITKCDW